MTTANSLPVPVWDLSDLYDREMTAEVLDEATARVMDAITTMLSGIRSAQTGSRKA